MRQESEFTPADGYNLETEPPFDKPDKKRYPHFRSFRADVFGFFLMFSVGRAGLEPATVGLKGHCSTN